MTFSMWMTPCHRAHLGPGWPGSWTRMPRRCSVARSPANMCKCSCLGLEEEEPTPGAVPGIRAHLPCTLASGLYVLLKPLVLLEQSDGVCKSMLYRGNLGNRTFLFLTDLLRYVPVPCSSLEVSDLVAFRVLTAVCHRPTVISELSELSSGPACPQPSATSPVFPSFLPPLQSEAAGTLPLSL